MLTATVLALVAALLHALWNLSVKQSLGDRFIALWGQFFVAGVLAAIVLVIGGGIPARGYVWAALSGLTHLPYCLLLAKAYGVGDFSLAYPIARGGGALVAGLGGIALLGDTFHPVGVVGMVVVAIGLFALAGRGASAQVIVALGVAVTIGVYSVVDAKGIRSIDTPLYAAASFVCITASTSVYALATGRSGEMVAAMRLNWRRFVAMGVASGITYALVQIAFQRAPVGYVTCLRESSVLIAAFVGTRYLGEGQATRRIAAAAVVVAGLLLLVLGR
ncbi:MAG: EamA family transporter [Actinomycetota bacterium]|nr:EamA family transporter [Actinomycetota bacterium]